MSAPPGLEAEARWFDGQSARPIAATVAITGGTLLIRDPEGGTEERWPLETLQAQNERGDSTLQLVSSPDSDARVVLDDPRMIDAIEAACPRLYKRRVDRGRVRQAAFWAAGAVGAVALTVLVLIPALANQLAVLIPPEREQALGEAVADQFRDLLGYLGDDEGGTPAFCAAPEGLDALERMAARIGPGAEMPYPLRIRVLDHDMENAFALPGGQVVLFRGLIEAAESPEEIAGVLAHEIGHVVHRDPTRGVLRSAGTAGIFGLLVGDVFGASVAVAAGEAVLNASYQREAETRADEVAYELLDQADLPVKPFARFFERMAEEHGDMEGAWRYIASHPGLKGRAERAAAADRVGDADYEPVLTAAEWQALGDICDETEPDEDDEASG